MKTTDLQQKIASLPGAGLVLEGELPVAWLAPSLIDAYEARSGLRLRLEVRPVNDNVLVLGKASIVLGFACSHTGLPAETTLVLDFSELFVPEDSHEFNLGDGVDVTDIDAMDDEPYLIKDGIIDLETLVREELVLAQDPYPIADAGSRADDADELPAWSSASVEVDPRWAALAKVKLD
ncbi:MAG: hypothetical protein CO096_08595 [Armatimonadetes bacterium CG_4_9_14_3_um_filter_66_14]|nr:MAG: hypothetical protein CO096_08595 [Armatimonadetes bacterium CG_4_9_14_3_um_filter_66_14]